MKIRSILVLLCVVFSLNAQNAKIKSLESQRKKALEEIELTSQLLKETSNSKKNVLYRLNLLSQQIEARKKVVNLLHREIESINNEIKSTEKEIKKLEAELEYKKANYAKSLQHIFHHKSNQDKFLFILSGEDFAQSYRRMRYLKEYAGWQQKQGMEITSKQQELKNQQQKLVVSKNNKMALMQQKEIEGNNLREEETKRQGEVKILIAQEKDLQKELDKKTKQAAELDRQIVNAIAEEVARANANETRENRKADTVGGYAMTKEERQLSSDFASNQGRLPYPLKGSYKITGYFGLQKPEGLKYVTLTTTELIFKLHLTMRQKAYLTVRFPRYLRCPGIILP